MTPSHRVAAWKDRPPAGPIEALRYCLPANFGIVVMSSFAVAVSITTIAIAADTYRISQKNRAFSLNSLTVGKGDVLQFINDDDFIHQIYIKSDDFNVDTEESSPGDTITVPFTVSGTFEVHCHIHPKMRLVVTVK